MMNTSYTLESIATEEQTAAKVGSGTVQVFATPMMVALMEGAAVGCLKPYLEPGQTSVGTMISTSHVSATPVGMKVRATATVTNVDGKKVEFHIVAEDEAGIIGEATHTRMILNQERFEQKALAKLNR